MARKGLAVRTIPIMGLLAMGVLAVVAAACENGEKGAEPTAAPSLTAAAVTATGTVTPGPTFVPATPVGTVEARVPSGKIAFASRRDGNGEIYLLTAESEVNLTNNPAEDENPDISPDGSKIAFSSSREGTPHIYVMNVDGSGLVKLTDEPLGDMSPRWSPDGKRMAFSRTGAMMVMDSDGSNVQQVTEPKPEATAPLCEAGGFLGGWSPDGQRLTFYAASATRGLGQVCTVKVDGSELTVVASEPPAYHVEPSWSSDGQWIVYRFIQPDGNHEIYKIRPDGTSSTDLTNNPAMDIEPDWSPDGQWIVFSSFRFDNDFDLYIMRPDGSGVARVTNTLGKDSDPSWGP